MHACTRRTPARNAAGWLCAAALACSLSALAAPTPPATAPTPPAASPAQPPADEGWPRVWRHGEQELVIHEPQIDAWDDWARLRLRAAIAVRENGKGEPRYGVLEISTPTEIDRDSNTVLMSKPVYTPRFAQAEPLEAGRLAAIVREVLPDGQPLVVSLDRLLPYLEQQKLEQRAVQVSLDPPLIFHSTRPATLLGFYGAPEFRPVGDSGLQAAVNTPATVLLDAAADGPAYYLLLGESWLTTRSLRDGPWTQPAAMPAGFAKLPEESWGELRQAGTGKHLAETPAVYYAEAPAELLITRGAPKYRPVRGTKLQAISNTESAAFLHLGERRHYLLIAGRWFRAASLEGPWEAATTSLPADFAKIPETDPLAWVLASVPGTEAAEDAVRLASVPQKATLQRADLKFSANYAGEPRFRPIEGSDGVRYAANASDPVLAVADRYYAVKDGVWFEAAAPAGPWQVCTSVPPALYTIPASSPMHNVTYVQVYDSTPTTVTTGYTAGYNGQYVMNGLLLFGAGMALGYALHDHDDDYWYRPWYWGGAPRPYYSYGYGAVYRPGYGYGAAGWARGPYAAAAGRTWYNPATGAWARGGAVATPYGVAGGRAGYNPWTDTYGARIGGANAYGSWGRSYVERGDDWVAAGHRSGPAGNTGWVRTSEGGKALVRNGQVYAGKDGEVYRRTGRGEWQQYSGGQRWQAASTARTNAAVSGQPRTGTAQGLRETAPAGRERPATRPETRPATRPAERPETRPATRPAERPETRPATRPAERPETRPATRPAERPETRPAPRPETRPAGRPETRPETARPRPETRPQPAPARSDFATRQTPSRAARETAPAGLDRDFGARSRGERSIERSQHSTRSFERSQRASSGFSGGGGGRVGGGGGGGRRR